MCAHTWLALAFLVPRIGTVQLDAVFSSSPQFRVIIMFIFLIHLSRRIRAHGGRSTRRFYRNVFARTLYLRNFTPPRVDHYLRGLEGAVRTIHFVKLDLRDSLPVHSDSKSRTANYRIVCWNESDTFRSKRQRARASRSNISCLRCCSRATLNSYGPRVRRYYLAERPTAVIPFGKLNLHDFSVADATPRDASRRLSVSAELARTECSVCRIPGVHGKM